MSQQIQEMEESGRGHLEQQGSKTQAGCGTPTDSNQSLSFIVISTIIFTIVIFGQLIIPRNEALTDTLRSYWAYKSEADVNSALLIHKNKACNEYTYDDDDVRVPKEDQYRISMGVVHEIKQNWKNLNSWEEVWLHSWPQRKTEPHIEYWEASRIRELILKCTVEKGHTNTTNVILWR